MNRWHLKDSRGIPSGVAMSFCLLVACSLGFGCSSDRAPQPPAYADNAPLKADSSSADSQSAPTNTGIIPTGGMTNIAGTTNGSATDTLAVENTTTNNVLPTNNTTADPGAVDWTALVNSIIDSINTTTPADTSSESGPSDIPSLRQACLASINQYRSSIGVAPLSLMDESSGRWPSLRRRRQLCGPSQLWKMW